MNQIIFLILAITVSGVANSAVPIPANSFWTTPIPLDAPLAANSSNYVSEFIRQFHTHYGTVSITTDSFNAPVYVVEPGTPTVAVNQWKCQVNSTLSPTLKTQLSSVPIPSNALSSPDSDGEMIIYDPTSDTLWEFWQIHKVKGKWQACWGGQIENYLTSSGIFSFPYGVTATGLPLAAGQITAEELQNGQINHVMGIALVDLADKSIYSWPANRSDGKNLRNLPNQIPEGTRFRLDPTINVNTLNLTPVGKIIAKAAQTYGFVVWDKSGAITLRAENVLSYTVKGSANPYPALFGGKQNWAILQNFPWDKLQFLVPDYGK